MIQLIKSIASAYKEDAKAIISFLPGLIAIYLFTLIIELLTGYDFLGILFLYSAIVSVRLFFYDLFSTFPQTVLFAGCALAVILFALRGYAPKIYAMSEIAAGVYTINLAHVGVDYLRPLSLFPLAGGVYIVIRGLDNYAKAIDPKGLVGRFFTLAFNNPRSANYKTANIQALGVLVVDGQIKGPIHYKINARRKQGSYGDDGKIEGDATILTEALSGTAVLIRPERGKEIPILLTQQDGAVAFIQIKRIRPGFAFRKNMGLPSKVTKENRTESPEEDFFTRFIGW